MGPFQYLLNEEVLLYGISRLGVEASVEEKGRGVDEWEAGSFLQEKKKKTALHLKPQSWAGQR